MLAQNYHCQPGMEWNERKILVWNMELLKYGKKWKNFPYFHTIFMLSHFKTVYRLSAVNKAAFDQTHKMMKKSCSKRSIQMNRIEKGMESKTRLLIFQHWRLNCLQLHYRPSFKVQV